MRTFPWLLVALAPALGYGCGDDQSGNNANDAGDGEGGQPPVLSPFGLDSRPSNSTCRAPEKPVDDTGVKLERAFPMAFNLPIAMTQAPGDATQFYVAERAGNLMAFTVGDSAAAAVLTIPNVNAVGEGGFLGFAFHPQWPAKKEIYVSYTTFSASSPVNVRSVIARVKSTDGRTFDASTLEELLTFDQPFTNHKGGNLAFGPDGFLYAGFGDGGSGGDPFTNGQNRDVLFGKFLRLDIDRADANLKYGIPKDNPFAQGGGRAEIFAYGVRNPWRWSFDKATGDLWVGDVGQDKWEEVDVIKLGGNYGWNTREGTHCYPSGNSCKTVGFIDPIIDYPHTDGNSITGGYVYRGSAIPGLIGKFVFGDYGSGRIWSLEDDGRGTVSKKDIAALGSNALVSFGQDLAGEIYTVSIGSGIINRLAPAAPAPASTFPQRLSQTGCVDRANPKQVVAGVIPYAPNSPLWSDGAEKQRFFAIPDGTTITVKRDGDWDFPIGTVLLKNFSLGAKRIETRLYVHHDDASWAGYTYEWNDSETDATLLPSSKTKQVGNQSWLYPSRSQCNRCHTEAAGFSLGLETGQLNGDLVYPTTNRKSNQLATLDHIGMFAIPIGAPASLTRYPHPQGSDSLADRARAYLHSNCSTCHRPGGGGRGDLDLRFGISLAQTNACGSAPQTSDLGITGAKVLDPGKPQNSILYRRMLALDAQRMPPLATSVIDIQGAKLIEDWITEVKSCP